MRGPGLVGYQPEAVRWSQDGRRVYFRWKQATEPRVKEMDTYVVERDGAGGLAFRERRQQLVNDIYLGACRLVAALGRLLRALAAALDRAQVC